MTESTSPTTQPLSSQDIDQDNKLNQQQPDKTQQPIKTQQINKLQKWLIAAIIVLLLIILAEMGYIIFQDNQSNQQTPTAAVPTQVEPTVLPTTLPTATPSVESAIEAVIAEVSQEFQTITTDYDAEMADSKPRQVRWVAADDLNIGAPDISGVGLNIFNCMEDAETKSLFKQTADKLGSEIDQIMDNKGFLVNQKNSSQSITDDRFYDYQQAYEKEGIKCMFVANPDCLGVGDQSESYYYFFACSDTFEDSYAQQAPYLKDLKIEKFYTISIAEKIGDFVQLGLHARTGGLYMIAKLIDGQWTKLYAGQDLPPCTLVEEHNVPEEIAPDCLPDL